MRNALRGIEAVEAVEFPSGERRRLHIPSGGAWGLTVASIPADADDLIAAAPGILAAIQERYAAIKAAFDAPHEVRQSGATKTAVLRLGAAYVRGVQPRTATGVDGVALSLSPTRLMISFRPGAEGPYIVNLG
jgi:hypothetical protein